MALDLESGDIPVPVAPATPVVSDGTGAKAAKTFTVGEASGVAAKLSENAARLDTLALYSGPPRIAAGLAISVTTLVGTVSAGIGISQGILALEANATGITILDDATVYLWLRQLSPSSAPEVVVSDTSPSAGAIYLGAVVTASGVSTIDTSGVLYVRGGLPWREVADAGAPVDTPGDWAILTKTGSGLWFWDGEQHYKLVPSTGATAVVGLAKVTGGGTDGSLTIVDGIITAAIAPT